MPAATTVVTPVVPGDAIPAPTMTPLGDLTPPPLPAPPPEPAAGLADARNQVGENVAPLTLEDAITLALINNPQRDAAVAALQAARARIGTARSAGGLQVGVGANAGLDRSFGGGSNSGTNNNNGTGTGGGNAGGNTIFGFDSTQSVSTTADIPLYTGGRVRAGRRVAEAGARFQAAQTLQVEQDLVLSTISAYISVLRTGQLLDVAESNLAVSRERRRIEQVRYDAGASARLDVLRADTTLADAQQRRIAASNAWAQSKAALNTLMGRVPETPVRTELVTTLTPRVPLPPEIAVTPVTGTTVPGAVVPGVTTPDAATGSMAATTTTPGSTSSGSTTTGTVTSAPTPGATTPAVGSSADLRALAGQQRPALAAGEAQVEAGEAGIDVARAQRKPSLGLSLTGLLRNPVTFAGRFALGLGLNVAQNLFDSGRARSQIDEARALAEQSRQNLGNQRLNVANQIEQSLLALDSAQKRLASADVAVVAAAEALRASQLGYEAGARTRLEVSDAQVALLTAQTDAVNARFEVADAQANLSAAVGVFTTEGQTAYERALTQETQQAQALAAQQPAPKKKRKKFLGIF
jgi:outer membrane protein TolC